jgi:hypothetical protein
MIPSKIMPTIIFFGISEKEENRIGNTLLSANKIINVSQTLRPK